MGDLQTFSPQGFIAMKADAIGMEVPLSSGITVRMEGSVAVVSVRGPLYHHPTAVIPQGMAADYDSLKAVMRGAFASEASAVVLSIDSPGGDASGCFDTAAEIRAFADASGKPFHAYVDGTTASAAYAIACVADTIAIPQGGEAGSVGVYMGIRDTSGAAEKAGVKVHLVGSGRAKGACIPGIPIEQSTLDEIGENVDAMADVFFALVAQHRLVSPDTIRAWEGRTFIGSAAVTAGLADFVASEDQLLAMVVGGQLAASAAEEPMEKEALLKALRALAEEGDADAKKMLAAFDGDGEPDGDEKEEAKAEETPHEEPDCDEPKEEAKALAKLAARVDSMERGALLASRPDLSESQRAALASVPTSALKFALSAIPKSTPAVVSQMQASLVTGTQGSAEKVEPVKVDETKAYLARAFGLSEVKSTGVLNETYRQTFGVPVEVINNG